MSAGSGQKDLVIIKLGGGLITHKTRERTARPAVMKRLAEEIAKGISQNGPRVVLGHGSGSFGHRAARRAGLGEGLGRASPRGAALTQHAVQELHVRVRKALLSAGLSPFSVSPSHIFRCQDGVPTSVFLEPLHEALKRGLLPVLHGDVVLDEDLGATVCSTETVLATVAEKLLALGFRIRRALWLGNTDGVYDEHDRTIAVWDPDCSDALLRAVGGSKAEDVTGGMRLRVDTALRLARVGIPSWVGDGRIAGNLLAALRNQEVGGTEFPSVRHGAGQRRR